MRRDATYLLDDAWGFRRARRVDAYRLYFILAARMMMTRQPHAQLAGVSARFSPLAPRAFLS